MTSNINSLAALLEASYGVRTDSRANPLVTQVGASATKILAYNPRRVGLIVVNNHGSQSIRVAPSKDVSATKGIVLGPSGGAISLTWDRDFELVAQEFYAIASGAATDIYILETMILANPDSKEV